MIKEIELINFENHEHTVLKNFHKGFNLLCGNSMIGKSSIIRAIKLVCYNEFDKESIAVGEKTCTVKLTTDKGSVTVVKGENVNKWIIEPLNGKKQEFNNTGKKVLQEVIDVTGLSVVSLGDIDLKINIMNQLDGHFLMAKIGDKDSSGSLRSQIIDEISGLIGVEPLIKEVSTDNLRLSKEIKNIESEKKQLQESKTDEEKINEYKNKISFIDEKYVQYNKNLNDIRDMNELKEKHKNILEQINSKKAISLPKINFSKFNSLEIKILNKYFNLNEKLKKSSFVDFSKIKFNYFNLKDCFSLFGKYKDISINEIKELSKIDFSKISDINLKMLNTYINCLDVLEKSTGNIDIIIKEKELCKQEIDCLLDKITVCPLTNNPISDNCKKNNL